MPKRVQVTEQTYTREEAKAYHQLMLEAVKEAVKWIRLSEILKQDLLSMPGALESFAKYVEDVRQLGDTLRVRGNDLSNGEVRELFSRLCGSKEMCAEYYRMIDARVKFKKKAPKLLSLVELEERYQHRLYKRARVSAKMDVGPRFEKWRSTDDCRTFYDDMR